MAVAMTGGTGFLGTRLVHGLLATGTDVIVLVRGGAHPAESRLLAALKATASAAAPSESSPGKVSVVEADITEPRLGLPRRQYVDLAGRVDTVWHSAGSVKLHGRSATLRNVNVSGTANVLAFAERSRAAVRHVSTAFVAGTRRGTVTEREFSTEHGFENPYEESKHEAEHFVRDWTRRTRLPTTIFRPSILVTDRPASAGAPGHTIQQLGQLVEHLSAGVDPSRRPLPLRLPGRPDGYLNFVPVEHAVRTMLRCDPTGRPRDAGQAGHPQTYHVVHHQDVSLRTLAAAFEEVLAVSFSFVPGPVERPAPHERQAQQYLSGFLPYLLHRRQFEPGRLHPPHGTYPPVDKAYIVRSLRSAGIGVPRQVLGSGILT